MAKTASRSSKTSAKSKTASPKKRPAASSKSAPKATKKDELAAGEQEITIDRRRQQETNEAGEKNAAPKPERRKKVQRRRQIDPTTCERDYSDNEVEFMNAMDEYKRTSGRMFPTCSEVLEVIRSIGYAKLNPAELEMLGRSAIEDNDDQTEAAAFEDAEAELVG